MYLLTPEQKKELLYYIQWRRYPAMLALILNTLVLAGQTGISVFTASLVLTEEPFFQSVWACFLSLNGFPHLLFEIFAFVVGYGRFFGRNSDYDCVKKGNYVCEYREYYRKGEDKGRYPYDVYDGVGNVYHFTKFLSWKKVRQGAYLYYVTLQNGHRYAFLDESSLQDRVSLEK